MAHRAPIERQAAGKGKLKAGPGPFLIATWHAGEDGDRPLTGGHFNGKIDRPLLANRALDRAEMALLAGGGVPAGLEAAVVARWDFSPDISSETIPDAVPHRLDSATLNLAARALNR